MTNEDKAEKYADKILSDSKYPFIFNKQKVKAYIIKVYLDSLKCCEEAYNTGLAEGRKDVTYMKAEDYDKYLSVCRENEQLKKEINDLQTKHHIVPEHYLSEAIDRCNELKTQIEKMKNFVKSMYEANKNDAYCREYLGTILNEWS